MLISEVTNKKGAVRELASLGITTVEQFQSMKDEQLLKVREVGKMLIFKIRQIELPKDYTTKEPFIVWLVNVAKISFTVRNELQQFGLNAFGWMPVNEQVRLTREYTNYIESK